MKRKGNLVISIYSHPEYYPPTLNAIEYLAEIFDKVYIVHRNLTGFDWIYPSNVTLIPSGELLSPHDAQGINFKKKVKQFFQFTRLLLKTLKKHDPEVLLIYDYMPLLSYRLIRRLIHKPSVLWYHNHDVADVNHIRKRSISWYAWKAETWVFPKLNVFSLPAVERKECFPMERLKGKFYFIPNFPSKNIYKILNPDKEQNSVFRILYQGSIGPEHGLEEIIPLLNRPIGGKEINLVLKGFISPEYLIRLQQLAEECKVKDKLFYIGPSGYKGVIENAATCHIGIGIHQKADIMNKTLGTASNKIYEYIASGMPVLLYDNLHFRKHLEHFEWAFFTDCSASSLISCLNKMISNYTYYSERARKDFVDSLNYENHFLPVAGMLQNGK